jgi:hypothetical protein
MLLSLSAGEYFSAIIEMSRAVEGLEDDNSALGDLYRQGVDYVYIGSRGDFSASGLDAKHLAEADNAELVYQTTSVSIFRIELPHGE